MIRAHVDRPLPIALRSAAEPPCHHSLEMVSTQKSNLHAIGDYGQLLVGFRERAATASTVVPSGKKIEARSGR